MNSKKKSSIFYRSVRMALDIMPGHFVWMLIIHVVTAILPLLGMHLSRRIYSIAQSPASGSYTFVQIIMLFLAYALYLLLMKARVVYYQRVAVQFGGLIDFEKKAKLILHKKCDQIDMDWYENPCFYNSLWEAKVASINVYRIVECAIGLLGICLNILLLSGYASTIHPSFVVLVVLTAVPALAEKVSTAVLKNRRRKVLTQLSKTEQSYRSCLTGQVFAKERLTYDSFDFLFQKWKTASNLFVDKDYNVGKKALRINAILTIFKALSIAAVYVLAGWFFFNGDIDFSGFMVTISTTLHLQAQYTELFTDIGIFSEFHMMVKPFFHFSDFENKPSVSDSIGAVKFRNVGFAYPTSKTEVLSSLNFEIKHGEKIAIVGVNGSGKTTLSKLLVGLLSPSSGTVVGQISPFYSVMFQDFQKYEMTLRENIAPNENVPSKSEKLNQLLNEMGIVGVPDNVILGREFGEVDLSGGQWQKIALARLFYRDGEVWVLDEPTSAIDPMFEKELNELIVGKAGEDRTLIVISHRLSVAKLVDRILVLEEGTVVEQGSHEALVQDPNSRYSKLWLAQTSWY